MILNLGSSRCFWAGTPRILGISVKEHMGYPRLRSTDIGWRPVHENGTLLFIVGNLFYVVKERHTSLELLGAGVGNCFSMGVLPLVLSELVFLVSSLHLSFPILWFYSCSDWQLRDELSCRGLPSHIKGLPTQTSFAGVKASGRDNLSHMTSAVHYRKCLLASASVPFSLINTGRLLKIILSAFYKLNNFQF